MGLFKNLLKKQIIKSVNSFNKGSHSRTKKSDKQFMQEIRKKQKLADDIRKQAKFQSTGLLKIVYDCVELVNTTVNPEVFFMRYNLMLENLEKLVGLECTGIFDNASELPSTALLRVEEQFTLATNDFLDRSFAKAKQHAETLKTDKGKINAINRYFNDMEKYIHKMSSESLEYFDKMKETNY